MPRRKLTVLQLSQLRAEYAVGATQKELAEKYNLKGGQPYVSRLLKLLPKSKLTERIR